MTRQPERRESFRMDFHPEAICRLKENGNSYTGTIRDISMVSMFMEVEDCPDVSGECDTRIILNSRHSRLVIDNLAGSIIRSDDLGIAIKFEERLEWFNVVPLYYKKITEGE